MYLIKNNQLLQSYDNRVVVYDLMSIARYVDRIIWYPYNKFLLQSTDQQIILR